MGDASRGYRRTKLGSLRARPRIIAFYSAGAGWRDAPRPQQRLTIDTASALVTEGFHLVRVRHRFRTIEIRLQAYLPHNS